MVTDVSTLVLAVDSTQVAAADRAMQGMAASAEKAEKQTSELERASNFLKGTLAGLGVAALTKEYIGLADTYTLITNKLGLVTNSSAELAQVQDKLFGIAQRNLTPYADTVDLYAKLSMGAQQLGANQSQLMKFTEGVGAALRISGASAQTASGGLLQLSQMMAGPIVQAQEFNSLVDAMPELLRAAAKNIDGAGGSIAALKIKVNEGKLTTKEFFDAFLKGSDDLIKSAQGMQMTVGQAWTFLTNELLRFVGESDKASGASATLANAIALVARNLDVIAAAAIGFASAKLAGLFIDIGKAAYAAVANLIDYVTTQNAQKAATLASAQAVVTETAAKVANLAATEAVIVAARAEAVAKLASLNTSIAQTKATIAASEAAGAQSFALATLRTATAQLAAVEQARAAVVTELAILGRQGAAVSAQATAATVAHTAAQGALTAAQGAGAAAAGLASRALGLLGGPLGVITTVIGLGVTAWQLWGSNATEAADKANSAGDKIEQTSAEMLAAVQKENVVLAERLKLLTQTNAVVGGTSAAETTYNKILSEQQQLIQQVKDGKYSEAAGAELVKQKTLQLAKAYEAMSEQQRLNAEIAKNDGTLKAELNSIINKQRGITDDYTKSLNTLAKAREAGMISESEQIKLAQELTDKQFKLDKSTASAKDSFDKLVASLRSNIEETTRNTDATLKLNKAEEFGIEFKQKLNAEYKKLTPEQRKAVEALINEWDASLKANAAVERGKQIRAEAAKVENDYLQSVIKTTDGINGEIEKQRLANFEAQYGAEAAAYLALAKDRATAASLRATAAFLEEHGQAGELSEEFRKQAAALDELVKLKEQGIHLKAAKEANEEWKKVTDSIYNGLTDSLYRAFESGKDFFSTFWDGVKNTFKTTVLKMAIQGVMSPVQQALGIAQGAGGAGGAGGILGTLGNLANMAKGGFDFLTGGGSLLGSSLGGWLTDFGGSVGTAAGQLGGKLFDAGFEKLGNFIGGNMGTIGDIAGMAGDALGYIGAISNLGKGKYGAAAGSALGTFFGGPIGGAIGNMVGGFVDKIFGGAGTHHAGAGYVSGGQGSGMEVRNGGYGLDWSYGDSVNKYRNQGVADALKNITGGAAEMLNTVSKLFGGAGGYQVGAYFASDNNRASQGGRSVLLNGQVVSSWGGSGLDKDPTKGLQELTAALAGQVRDAMTQINLPDWAKQQLQALPSSTSLEDLAKAVYSIKQTQEAITQLGNFFKPLGGVFAELSTLSADATMQLAQFAGGIDALTAKTAQFVSDYYTQGEQAALQASSVQQALDALGLGNAAGSLLKKEDFRALVESVNVQTEEGRKQLAGLLTIGPDFAKLAEYLTENNVSLAALAATAPASELVASLNQATADATQATANAAQATAEQIAITNSTLTTISQQSAAQIAAIQELAASITTGFAGLGESFANSQRRFADEMANQP